MKKVVKIIFVLFSLMLLFCGCSKGNNDKKDEKINYSVEEMLSKVIDKAIEDDPDKEYGMKTLSDQKNKVTNDNLEDILGLSDKEFEDDILGAMECKPDDTWSPHSVVIVRVKDGVDTSKIAEKILKNTNPTRFGCLKPETVKVSYYANFILLVDSDNDTADIVVNSFKSVVNNDVTTLTRENDWNFNFFEE